MACWEEGLHLIWSLNFLQQACSLIEQKISTPPWSWHKATKSVGTWDRVGEQRMSERWGSLASSLNLLLVVLTSFFYELFSLCFFLCFLGFNGFWWKNSNIVFSSRICPISSHEKIFPLYLKIFCCVFYLNVYIKCFKITFTHLFVTCACHGTHVEISGHLEGIVSLLLPLKPCDQT